MILLLQKLHLPYRVTVEKKLRDKGLALIDRHALRNEAGNTIVPTSMKAKILGKN